MLISKYSGFYNFSKIGLLYSGLYSPHSRGIILNTSRVWNLKMNNLWLIQVDNWHYIKFEDGEEVLGSLYQWVVWGWSNGTESRALALHAANLGSITSIPYGIPAGSNPWLQSGVKLEHCWVWPKTEFEKEKLEPFAEVLRGHPWWWDRLNQGWLHIMLPL